MPSFDGGDDFVGVCSPFEGVGIIVGLVEKPIDGGREFADGSEDAALEAAP